MDTWKGIRSNDQLDKASGIETNLVNEIVSSDT